MKPVFYFPELKALRAKMDLDGFLIESSKLIIEQKLTPPTIKKEELVVHPIIEEIKEKNISPNTKTQTTQIIEMIKATERTDKKPKPVQVVEVVAPVVSEVPVVIEEKPASLIPVPVARAEKTEKEKEMEKLIRNMTESRVVRKRHKFKDNALIFRKDTK